MRRALLIFGTLLVVAIAFGIFAMMQKDIQVASNRPVTAASRPAAASQIGAIGRGSRAWLVNPDKYTGLPKTRFRGEEFTPKGGDQVLVDHPEVEFYLGHDRNAVIRIEGRTGLVIVPGQGPRIRADLSSTPTQPPSRGSMRDVKVTYYPTLEDLQANRPQHTLTLNNAYFDNETFEIATEEYVDEQGRTIPAREVPVTVRGDVFDFDGRGLLIRWDDSRDRLRSLTVFHGEQLVIKKNLDELQKKKQAAQPRAMSLPLSAIQLVAADRRTAVEQAATAKQVDIYRATFADGVTITQQQKTLATAQELHVDFLSPGSDTDQPQATTKASERSARQPAGAAAAKATPAQAAQSKQSVVSPVKRDLPIVIRWGGPMTVTLAPDEPIKPLSSDDAVIHFSGSEGNPVRLHDRVSDDNGRDLEGMWVAYQTQTGEARVEGSPTSPAKMSEQREKHSFQLSTPQLRIFSDGKVVLRGPSSALITGQSKNGPQTINAAWKELAEVTFVGKAADSAISALHLQGDVNITNPRIPQFKAGALDLQFKPGSEGNSSSPILQQITASRDVDCVLADRKGEKRSNIRCQNLKVAVDQGSDGEPYPTAIDADGSVYAFEDKPGADRAYIKAQRVRADLAPASEQQGTRTDEYEVAGLRNLRAYGQVEMQSAKKELVKAERVQVVQESGKQHVVLEGAPASVQDSAQDTQSLLSGGFIEYDSAAETVLITGGGRLVVPDSRIMKKGKGLPLQISWSGPATVSGSKNSVTADGDVQLHYTNEDGVINDATGDHVDVALTPKGPATQPTEGRKQLAFLSGRSAQQLVLSAAPGRDIRLRSLTPGPNNTYARQVNIRGPRLDCFLGADGKLSRLEIPAPPGGMAKMLYLQLPSATRAPAKPDDALQGKGLPGATAFGWKDRLIYDAAKGQFIMRGDVLVRHEPQNSYGKPFEVQCDTAIADVAMGGKSPAEATGNSVVTRMVLTGRPVQIIRGTGEIRDEMTAPMVEYNPKTDDVIAKGTAADPVRIEQGLKTGSFEFARMNLKNNDFEVSGVTGQGRVAR